MEADNVMESARITGGREAVHASAGVQPGGSWSFRTKSSRAYGAEKLTTTTGRSSA